MAVRTDPEVPHLTVLLEALRSFPAVREVEHCGVRFNVSPFDYYGTCPHCGTQIKLRSFSAATELEDVFDAVFKWLQNPQARAAAERRCREIADDSSE